MEKARIGEHAGYVWHVLEERKSFSVREIGVRTRLTDEAVLLAVGWLARENQIFVSREEGVLRISRMDVGFSFG